MFIVGESICVRGQEGYEILCAFHSILGGKPKTSLKYGLLKENKKWTEPAKEGHLSKWKPKKNCPSLGHDHSHRLMMSLRIILLA